MDLVDHLDVNKNTTTTTTIKAQNSRKMAQFIAACGRAFIYIDD